MDETEFYNSVVSWAVFIAVLPLFAVIFAISCLFVAPFLVMAWVGERLRSNA